MDDDANVLNYAHKEDAIKLFLGSYYTQIPLILEEDRVPAPVAWIMERALVVLNNGKIPLRGIEKAVAKTLWFQEFDTGDGVVRYPDGSVEIVLDADTVNL